MTSSIEETFAGGAVTVKATPVETGTVEFKLRYGGETLYSEAYQRVFESGKYPRQQRSEVCNKFAESLSGVDGIDGDSVADSVKNWLHDLKNTNEDVAVGPLAQEIVDGTETPVEIWEAPDENTVWRVTLSFRGTTKELEFDADVMVGDGSTELATKLIHNYHERVEVTEEDWNEIADYWYNHSEVVGRTTVDTNDEIANRVLSFLANSVEPTQKRENLENSHATAWVDESNDGGAKETDGPVVWLRDDLLTDELEAAGKKIQYKGQLIQDLKRAGHLYDTPGENTSKRPQSWTPGSSRPRVWPFDPDSIDVDPSVTSDDSSEAHSEVDA